jgi:hypothetical protein
MLLGSAEVSKQIAICLDFVSGLPPKISGSSLPIELPLANLKITL